MTAELPAGVLLRVATVADRPHVERLLITGGLSTESVAPHACEFFIAEAHDGVIAVSALEQFGGDALLRSVYVDPAWRGRGVASGIVEHVLTAAALDAIDAVYVFSTATDRFFARFGFISLPRAELPFTITRANERAGGCSTSATSMRLRLAEP